MTRHCPFCEAPISQQQLASVPMPVCPACQSSLPVEFWNSASLSPTPSAIQDEIAVDFGADDAKSAEGDELATIDDLSVDWLDEVTVADNAKPTDDLATVVPTHLRNEFNLGDEMEAAEKPFELETDDGGHGKSTADEYTLPLEAMENSSAPITPFAAGLAGSGGKEAASNSAKQPFEMKDGFELNAGRAKRKRGIVALLLSGVLLAAGLIGALCVLQLASWWVLRMDPFHVALMMPKSAEWLFPYSLTEEGRRLAMQKSERPTTAGEALTDEDLAAHGWRSDDVEAQGEDQAPVDDQLQESGEQESAEFSEDDSAPADDSNPVPTPAMNDPPQEDAVAPEGVSDDRIEDEFSDDSLPIQEAEATVEENSEFADDEPQSAEGTAMPTLESRSEDTAADDPITDLLDDLNSVAADAEVEQLETEAENPTDVPPPPAAAPLITNVPVFQVADVRQALVSAERATELLNDAKRRQVDVATLTATARDFYTSLCQMAETATLVDSNTAISEIGGVRALLANLAQDAKKTRMIGTTASGWIDRKLGNGVVVAGTVEEVQPVGRFQEISLRPIGSDATMLLVTADPNDATQRMLAIGRNVLVAGYVLRDPESQLPSFLGTQPTVIWLRDVVVEVP